MNVTAKQAGEMIKEGWTVLDVRPPNEIEQVGKQKTEGTTQTGVGSAEYLVE